LRLLALSQERTNAVLSKTVHNSDKRFRWI